jgi:hypothetical protein
MSGPGDWAEDAQQQPRQPYKIVPPPSGPPPEAELFISNPCGELFGALAAAQAEITNPKKDKTVTIRQKSGFTYSYNYADLATMLDETRPHLAKHGLSVVQVPSVIGDYITITTILGHSSGQYLRAMLCTRVSSDMKELGGQITYLRRYAYGAVICIASDDDLDGDAPGSASDKTYEKRNSGGPAARPAAPPPIPPPPPPAGPSPAQVKAELAELLVWREQRVRMEVVVAVVEQTAV